MKLLMPLSIKPQVIFGTGKPHTLYVRCDPLASLAMHNFGGPAIEKENTVHDIAEKRLQSLKQEIPCVFIMAHTRLNESKLSCYLNVKELLAQSRCDI